VFGLLVALAALAIWIDPGRAPAALFFSLGGAARPWLAGWTGALGTALRPALVWGALAVALSGIAQLVALSEPLAAGRPLTGRLTYLAVVALLAALISVLNARTPGGRVWAGLMVILLVVFTIPWLEEPGRMHRAGGTPYLQLDPPWTLFYALLVVVGVTNYLPTRYGGAAACLGLLFAVEYLGLTRTDWTLERRATVWEWVSWTLALSVRIAHRNARQPGAEGRFEAVWIWFRDHWGVVWALRVSERFNREAALAGWPLRLRWFGLEPVDSPASGRAMPAPALAETTLRGLLRRFAQPWRLDLVNGPQHETSCDQPDVERR
jgi:hypothetical protein